MAIGPWAVAVGPWGRGYRTIGRGSQTIRLAIGRYVVPKGDTVEYGVIDRLLGVPDGELAYLV